MAKGTAAKAAAKSRDATRGSAKQGSKKGKSKGSASASTEDDRPRKTRLRSAGHPRTERRFTARASAVAVGSALATSIGGVCAGAGVVGQFVLSYRYAPWLLGIGAVLAVVGFFMGSTPQVIRVGDLGVGVEKDGIIERMAWHEIDAVRFAANTISFSGRGRVLSISLSSHPEAASLALAEARARIPSRLVDVTDKLPSAPADAGELVQLEPAQLAGLRCKASDRIIALEKDGRFCGQCGQTYHRASVPPNCLSCDARLA
jgi:hypothetical protein